MRIPDRPERNADYLLFISQKTRKSSCTESQSKTAETWLLLLRASGTESLMRIYCESCLKKSVAKLLESARKFALGA